MNCLLRDVQITPFQLPDGVGMLYQCVVMRTGNQGSSSVNTMLEQHVNQCTAGLSIKTCSGFIGQNNVWLADKCTGYCNALLLATRHPGAQGVVLRNTQASEELASTLIHGTAYRSWCPVRLHGSVSEGCQFVEQIEVLEDHTDLASAQSGQCLRVHGQQVFAIEKQSATASIIQPCQRSKQTRFADSRCSDDTDECSTGYAKRLYFQ